jgi:hypothetical protein
MSVEVLRVSNRILLYKNKIQLKYKDRRYTIAERPILMLLETAVLVCSALMAMVTAQMMKFALARSSAQLIQIQKVRKINLS